MKKIVLNKVRVFNLLAWIGWLMTPESSSETVHRARAYAQPWQSALKTLFWLTGSVALGIWIARICH